METGKKTPETLSFQDGHKAPERSCDGEQIEEETSRSSVPASGVPSVGSDTRNHNTRRVTPHAL